VQLAELGFGIDVVRRASSGEEKEKRREEINIGNSAFSQGVIPMEPSHDTLQKGKTQSR